MGRDDSIVNRKLVIDIMTGLTRVEPLNKILSAKKEEVSKIMNVINQVGVQMVQSIKGAFAKACAKELSGKILPRNPLLEKYSEF